MQTIRIRKNIALAAATLLIGGLASSLLGQAEAETTDYTTGGYRFRGVSLTTQDAGGDKEHATIAVSYLVEWANDEFPGKKMCVWSLLDGDGDEIGRTEFTLTTLQREYDEPIETEVWVDAESKNDVEGSSISCAATRLDQADGRFAITNVSVSAPGALPGVVLTNFDWEWMGEGSAKTPQLCDVSVYNRTGEKVADQAGAFTVGSETNVSGSSSFSVLVGATNRTEIDHGSVACHPLGSP